MRTAVIAAFAVLGASALGRLLAPGVGLYLEPWHVTQKLQLWRLVTWIPAGASLTFVAHALLLGVALWRGAAVAQWLGATFIGGVLTTLSGVAVPAVYSCTFTGAGVGASVSLWAWASSLTGPRRVGVGALALVPAALDAAVDGLYVLLPYACAFVSSALWARARRFSPQSVSR